MLYGRSSDHLPRIVIIGAGFGGLTAAHHLRHAPGRVILIDRHNYHLFQPLLYQVATGGLSPDEIAYPVRSIFHSQRNFNFHLSEVERIDLESRRVFTRMGEIPYDYLILSAGSRENYFGIESIKQNAITLKDLEDAIALRNHLLSLFERADQAVDVDEQVALMTIFVAGGGPTGVELSGATSELVRLLLKRDFPFLDPSRVHIVLLEAADRLLAGFPEGLSESALRTLQGKGVEVRFHAAVTGFDGRQVLLKDGEVLNSYTLIWTAGVRVDDLAGNLPVEKGKGGRIKVADTLQLPGHPEVFVIGDAALLEQDGQPLPMMAPVAIQQAKIAAENVRRSISGKPLLDFIYKDPGSLATIGRNQAVARLGRLKFHGFLAWILWLGVHIVWLIGYRNKVLVLINWAWDYIFYERGVRLITQTDRLTFEQQPDEPARIMQRSG